MSSDTCGCKVEPIKPKQEPPAPDSSTLSLIIDGMGCLNCAVRVQNALLRVHGTEYASVDLEPPLAMVTYDPGRMGADELIAAVASAGAGTSHEYRARTVGEPYPTLA